MNEIAIKIKQTQEKSIISFKLTWHSLYVGVLTKLSPYASLIVLNRISNGASKLFKTIAVC